MARVMSVNGIRNFIVVVLYRVRICSTLSACTCAVNL